MRNSSSSTPPCIKAQHRAAKQRQRAIRRRRIDLVCGCSIFLHISCRGHGFTHRGTHHCTSGGEWRLYLGNTKSPLFQDIPSRGHPIHNDSSVSHPDTVQPQRAESVGSPQGVSELPSLDDFPDSFWDDVLK
uniref:Transcriptional activator protein n=1 Tax=Blainvillea yellow spot virus TaxID=536081 RepID=L7Y868_9GEMI|nr:transactivating protein [Blainvillea yellow spot virus]AGD98654.1 transactivating protein [Blainvillea yellow spot virus]AGD98659.1 transactivating protein [Blainvillea yellow spot virus]